MSALIPYVQIRGETYYYVRRVPLDVIRRPLEFKHVFKGQATVRWSLHTKDKREALTRYADFDLKFDEMVRRALPGRLPTTVVGQVPEREVTLEFLKNVRAAQREGVLKRYRQTVIHIEQDSATYREELERLVDEFETKAEHISDVLYHYDSTTDPAIDVPTIAREIVRSKRIDAHPGSNALSLLQNAVREGLREGFGGISAIASGISLAVPEASSLPSKAPTITAVVISHLARQVRPRTIAEFKEALRSFTSLHGDLPLNELERSHFLAYCVEQARTVVGGRSPGSVERPMSAATIQKKVRLLRSAIASAIKTGMFDGPNPATDIDVKLFAVPSSRVNMPDKRRFNDEELALVFSQPWFSGCVSATNTFEPGDHRLSGLHFWVPVLALLTGCRASELGGLMLTEIRIDHAHPHIIIRNNAFRPTKSGKLREVPLLAQLMELGFADLVKAARKKGYTRLFEDWSPPKTSASGGVPAWSNGTVLRAFNNRLIPKALKDILVPAARREVTFHSFRGAFKNMLGRSEHNLPPNYVNYVVGHSLPDLDKRYIGKIDLGLLYKAIHGCRFDAKLLPSPPPQA